MDRPVPCDWSLASALLARSTLLQSLREPISNDSHDVCIDPDGRREFRIPARKTVGIDYEEMVQAGQDLRSNVTVACFVKCGRPFSNLRRICLLIVGSRQNENARLG